MTTRYTIEVEVNEEWLRKWDQEALCQSVTDRLQLWAEIATAGKE